MMIINAEKNRCGARHPAGAHNEAVEQSGTQNKRCQPQQALAVHQRRVVWPEHIVKAVAQRAEGPEEIYFYLFVYCPAVIAFSVVFGIAAVKTEKVPGRG